ncbi:hypothetical protein K9M79_03220 [Candidatus Woesearchaeota archaeon]|nr:hypothetical protein [Candidatus Woesearchaeota archaeon]
MIANLLSLFNRKDPFWKYNGEDFLDKSSLLDDLLYHVNAGSLIFIKGKTGKTFVLYQIIRKFRGSRKVVYLDCKTLKKSLNIEDLLFEKYGSIGKLLKIRPKNMVVLLDNIKYLSERNAERVKFLFDHSYIRSVVFTAQTASGLKLTESIMHRMGNRTFETPKVESNDLLQIANKYCSVDAIKSKDALSSIFKRGGYSLSNFKKNLLLINKYAKKKGTELQLQEYLKIIK